jgi:hypothetical protein
LKTPVRCIASGWQGLDNVLRYQFYRSAPDGSQDMIGFTSAVNFIERTLPPTSRITVKVIDKFDQFTNFSVLVNISGGSIDDIIKNSTNNNTNTT